MTLTEQAAIAIENTRLYTELSQRLKQLEVLPGIYERIIAVGIQDIDRILDLLYEVASSVLDLSDAQVQFAFYEESEDQVIFPLAIEQDNGEIIDEVRWGERRPKYREEKETGNVEQFQPRPRGRRFGLTEYVIHAQQAVLIPDDFMRRAESLKIGESRVEVWPKFGRLNRPTHSWLGVPMVVGGQVIGVMSIQSLEVEHAFDEGHVQLLSTVANQAAVAIENSRLYSNLNRQLDEVRQLQLLSLDITSKTDLDELLKVVTTQTNTLVQADFTTILLYDDSQGGFFTGYRVGAEMPQPSLPTPDGLANRIVQTGAEIIVENCKEATELKSAFVEAKKLVSTAGFPLAYAGVSIGVLFVNFQTHHRFNDREKHLLRTIASQTAVATVSVRERSELRSRLVRAERLLIETRFATSYIHRVNNLVGTIPIRVGQIQEKLTDEPEVYQKLRPYLEGILQDAYGVNPITEDLANLIKEGPKVELVDLTDTLARVARRVRIETPGEILLEEDYQEDLWVRVVIWEISDALWNILRNGAEAMLPEGGLLTLGAAKVEDQEGRRFAELRIHNTGPKIPEDMVDRIFEPFRSTKPGGTGYGLWRAQQAILAHDGSIVIENDDNDLPYGVTAVIRLPTEGDST